MSGQKPLWRNDGHAVFLLCPGGHPAIIADRVAFIEKTPRVRIRRFGYDDPYPDHLNWASGQKGNGPDEKSKDWCVQMLNLLERKYEVY
jgi:hypothetical protein